MKSNVVLSLSIAAIVGTAIYAPVSTAATNYAMKNSVVTESTAQNRKDGGIIGELVALNNNEIMASQEAVQKATNHSVKRYAEMIERDHKKNLDQVLKLSEKLGIAPIETKAVSSLQHAGKKEVKQLSALNGANFDKAYIDDMVKDHTAALKLLDHHLVKATNPALKAQVERTRPHIVAHLEKGKKIQQELEQSMMHLSSH